MQFQPRLLKKRFLKKKGVHVYSRYLKYIVAALKSVASYHKVTGTEVRTQVFNTGKTAQFEKGSLTKKMYEGG